jgi:four helix bundle protein
MAETFEDLRVWQTARALTDAVYEHTKSGAFSQDFGLRDQIQRTAVSIMSNISPEEYFLPPVGARKASKAERGASSSLTSAKAFAGEIRCQLDVARDKGYHMEDGFDVTDE